MLRDIAFSIESGSNVVSVQCQLTERLPLIKSLAAEFEKKGISCYSWNLGQGVLRKVSDDLDLDTELATPAEVLAAIVDSPGNRAFILEDFHPFLHSSNSDSRLSVECLRSQLVNLVSAWSGERHYAILLGTQSVELPPVLLRIIPEFWVPLPRYAENVALLKELLPLLGLDADVQQLALSAGGLWPEEIKAGLRLVKAKGESPVKGLLDFKIERLKAFNLQITPNPNVGDFGGMDRIREGIHAVKRDYTDSARAAGIPLPKGWLLVGPPGTGKTFVSKFCASILEFPMISVDTGAIASGGASYLRRLIDVIEASAPAVVYFDEMDKLFPEAGQSADMTQRLVLGLLLTWLQDKTSHTFVIATLNRLDSLPPELTRLGRFDKIFYVGFPQAGERKDIMHLHLARFDARYRNGFSPMSEKDWRVIINNTVNFTGAELSRMVEEAARLCFQAGREIEIGLSELLEVRSDIVPLFLRDTERILKIENIAKYVATQSASPDHSIFAPNDVNLWGQGNKSD